MDNKKCYRYELLIKSIERYENGKFAEVDYHWCSDTISWLWKWRKISKEEMHSLCNRMIYLMDNHLV